MENSVSQWPSTVGGLTPPKLVEKFLRDTEIPRNLSLKCRNYFDHKQWTEAEASKLRARRQAPIVVNRCKPKVEGLVGIYDMRKTDPKAYPRTKKHEQGAEVVTDALRYVADKNHFEITRLDLAEEFFVEGTCGVFVGVKPKGKDVEVDISRINWDRILYDTRSRRKDFSDAKWKGLYIWMDKDDVHDEWPQADINALDTRGGVYETTEDRPRWRDENNRVRVVQMFYQIRDVWKMCVFSGDVILVPEMDSPYLDDDGMPSCPIELASANVDTENGRYGEVAGFLSQQDEINHRRSKFLFQNSTRQTFGNDNAIQDVEAAKRALRDPEGHLKINGDAKFGEDFGVIPTGDMSRAQYELYLDAKAEMDRSSFNAPLGGDTGGQDLSGVALGKLQMSGTIELNRQFSLLASFEKRIYSQCWCRIKQFWKEEKWIRVTDDQQSLRWVGLNSQITAQQMLQEAIEDESAPLKQRQDAGKILAFLQQTQNPRLNEVVTVKNDVSELEMDIIIDQSADFINRQQEQLSLIEKFASSKDIDIIEILELSQIRGKEELIARIEKRRADAAAAQQQANAAAQQKEDQIRTMERTADIKKVIAEADNISADTISKKLDSISTQIKNNLMIEHPDDKPQVIA